MITIKTLDNAPTSSTQPATETIAIKVKTLPLEPDKKLLAERIQVIKDLYADEYEQAKSDDDKSVLAKKLIAHGCRPNHGDHVGQFALFCEARDKSTEAGDIDTVFRAVDELDKRFKVDPLHMKLSVLQKLLDRKDTRENRFQLAETAITLLDEAFRQDRFEVAEDILQAAKQASAKSGDPWTRKRVSAKAKELEDLNKEFPVVQEARRQLEEDPTNPEAKLIVGKYLCFAKEEWKNGLPLLAESSDAKLRKMASEEVRGLDDPAAMASLADNWWQLAENEKKKGKLNANHKTIREIQLHAAYWYRKALPNLIGLNRDKISKRLNELDDKTRKSGLAGRRGAERTRVLREAGGTNASEAAVSSALEWFAGHQRNDGGWSFDHRAEACQGECKNHGSLGDVRIGATAMALLPFLGAGHTHKTGKYRKEVEGGLAFLSRSMNTEPGKLWEEKGTMYSQALATIALCEAYGMSRDGKLKIPAQMALGYLMRAQISADGGWRYKAENSRGDTSVTGWALMALKTGDMAKLGVDKRSFEGASLFLNSTQTGGGATYGYEAGRREGNATTAIGLLCRMHLGWKRDNEALQRGMKKLAELGPSENDLYYNYYATQVMRHYGGDTWKKWNEEMRENLIAKQAKIGHATGSWYLHHNWGQQGGRHYCTSMATMILEVYYRNPSIYPTHANTDDIHLVVPTPGPNQNDFPPPDKPTGVNGPFDQLQRAADLPRPSNVKTCSLGSVARDTTAEINLRLVPPLCVS